MLRDTRDVRRNSSEVMGHRGLRSTCDIRTPRGHEAGMVNAGTTNKPCAPRLGSLLLGNLRAKKLPYRSDGEQAIAENLAHEPAEDGATDDGDAQTGKNNTR